VEGTWWSLYGSAESVTEVKVKKSMEEMSLDNIAAYLHDRSRLSFTGHKRSILRSRLEGRLAELNLPNFSDYWSYLKVSREEDARLFDLVTTNETSFFRNPAQFDFLHDRIIPGFEQLPVSEKTSIRVLCAGCSTGEEPYSVAMSLFDSLRYPSSWQLEIVAGDLSENCLKVAKCGYYESDKLRKLPTGYLERYMESKGEGAVIKDELKKLVRFEHLNLNDLMKPEFPGACEKLGKFDIVFCRNVMIYFASPCQQLLVETLHRLLSPGGYLFTGDAEPLHLFKHDFRPVEDAGCLIYQKMEIPADARNGY
jgi:chemotaxis protein methyltransferase CheR